MTKSLPVKPSLEHLKNEAKAILKAHKAGDKAACAILRHLKKLAGKSDEDILAMKVSLHEVQHSLAMEYGFEAWSQMKARVAVQTLAAQGVAHWQRLSANGDEIIEMVCNDPEWSSLLEHELELGDISQEASQIRGRIASLEACHEHYMGNIRKILQMIGAMTPSSIFDCGGACKQRSSQVVAYRQSLHAWRAGAIDTADRDVISREVAIMLGEPNDEKHRLVKHLLGKISDNDYKVYADEDEDFELTESRIHHLEICNYNWLNNLRIVMHEIGEGKRRYEWHVPDGFNACGDLPDSTEELYPLMSDAAGWVAQAGRQLSETADILGEPTPEKLWLVSWLCKNVSTQQAKLDGVAKFPVPSL